MHIKDLGEVQKLNAALEETRGNLATSTIVVTRADGAAIGLSEHTFKAVADLVAADLYRQEAEITEELENLGVDVDDIAPEYAGSTEEAADLGSFQNFLKAVIGIDPLAQPSAVRARVVTGEELASLLGPDGASVLASLSSRARPL